jgi:hypothetical protein
MRTKIECQTTGRRPDGKTCEDFGWTYLACELAEDKTCPYQVSTGIEVEDLEGRESVPMPHAIAKRADVVKQGKDELEQLLQREIFKPVAEAMAIVDKYTYGSEYYNPALLDNLDVISYDMVLLSALGMRAGLVAAEAEANFKTLNEYRRQLHSSKFHIIAESYAAKLRRGRITDKALEHHVRVDKEYVEACESVTEAQHQVVTINNFLHRLTEFVNTLKKRHDKLLGERDRNGRQP